MATAVKLEKRKALDDIMDFMDKHFTGNLTDTARNAAEKAVKDGIISGPLWDEIGIAALAQIYRVRRIRTSKRFEEGEGHDKLEDQNAHAQPTSKTSGEGGHPGCEAHIRHASHNSPKWYHLDGKYYDLYNMTKKEVEAVADYYGGMSETYSYEKEYLMKIASQLKDKQKVKDVFDEAKLRELRIKS